MSVEVICQNQPLAACPIIQMSATATKRHGFSEGLRGPLALLFVGILGKGIIRGRDDLDSWFMGPDLILVGIGSGIGHVIDFSGLFFVDNGASATILRSSGKDAIIIGAYTAVAAFMYLFVLRIHQSYDPKQHPTPMQRKLWLGGLCNIVGVTTFAGLFFLLRRI